MERPYTICHILCSLNGKIAGTFMGTEKNQKANAQYARIREQYHAQAWLYGTTTSKEFTGFQKPDLNAVSETVPQGDFAAQTGQELYYVSLDTLGEIAWNSGTYRRPGRPDAHVIELLTETTPLRYRAYLRKQGVSYIIAGKEQLDCQLALQKLKTLFGIEKLMICGGGGANWTFVSQGAVDELSLLLSPTADADPHTPSVFEQVEQTAGTRPAAFRLKEVKPLSDDIVHLTYLVNHTEE